MDKFKRLIAISMISILMIPMLTVQAISINNTNNEGRQQVEVIDITKDNLENIEEELNDKVENNLPSVDNKTTEEVNKDTLIEKESSDDVNKSKVNEKYEKVSLSDVLGKAYSIKVDDENINKEVKEKLTEMINYQILKPKTSSKYEVALAYSDGSYSYVKGVDTLEEAIKFTDEIKGNYNEAEIIPAVISDNGQVIYSTNSMGRIWKHREGKPEPTNQYNANLYSTPELKNAFTYINHGYIDDVPIIEDRGNVAKIQAAGYNGWINKNASAQEFDMVVVPINQVTNPSCYLVKNGFLYHYISSNMTANWESGYSIRIGVAPSYLTPGKDYYSYDGVYFYEGSTVLEGLNKLVTDLKNNTSKNAINANNPYYNYYGYLPFRTRTNYTAAELNKFINDTTESHSKLRGIGEALIECQNKYGVNPLVTLAVAINESGNGLSSIAQQKNNLFGINATDFNPGGNADTFLTPSDSVREFTKNYISRGYADPADWRYFGGYLGNKKLGANVKYASDPYWGEKAAQHAFSIDYYLSNSNLNNLKDYNGYQLVVYKGANEVKKSDGTLLYKINPTVSGWGGYPENVVAVSKAEVNSQGKYEVFPDITTPLSSDSNPNKYHGNYEWNVRGLINNSNIYISNNQRTPFIPGYLKEDIDKNDKIDIEDLANLGLNYNNVSDDKDYRDYMDINQDGIIDIFDIVSVASKL